MGGVRGSLVASVSEGSALKGGEADGVSLGEDSAASSDFSRLSELISGVREANPGGGRTLDDDDSADFASRDRSRLIELYALQN